MEAQTSIAPLNYRSPFAPYRPFADATVGSWRELNDEVARIGGWKAYAREAYEATLRAAPPESPAQPPAPAPERRGNGAVDPGSGRQ